MQRLFPIVFAVILLTIFPFESFAKNVSKTNLKSKYFYSLPEESTSEWAYSIPECSPLNQKQLDDVYKCQKYDNHQTCSTKSKIRLSNALTKRFQDFKLVYHVFKSKADCVSDRESALTGE